MKTVNAEIMQRRGCDLHWEIYLGIHELPITNFVFNISVKNILVTFYTKIN